MKEIGTCKDCRWWGIVPRDFEFPNLRPCLKESQSLDIGDCIYPYYFDADDEQDAKFETGSDFGCIHWEAKQ